MCSIGSHLIMTTELCSTVVNPSMQQPKPESDWSVRLQSYIHLLGNKSCKAQWNLLLNQLANDCPVNYIRDLCLLCELMHISQTGIKHNLGGEELTGYFNS